MFVADRGRLPADFETLRFLYPVPPAATAVGLNTLSSIFRGRRLNPPSFVVDFEIAADFAQSFG